MPWVPPQDEIPDFISGIYLGAENGGKYKGKKGMDSRRVQGFGRSLF